MTTDVKPYRHEVFTSWGFWAIIAGVVSVILVFTQMQLLTSQESVPVGQQIGEIAGEIKRSAWRSFLGLSQPEPEVVAPPPGRDWFSILFIVTPVIAGLAIILAAVSLLMRENWRLGFYGVALGGGAILFQYVWWMAILILGFVLLIKIVENIGDIFSF